MIQEFFKKQSAAFYASALGVLAGIASIVCYLIGSIGGYYDDMNITIVILLAAGVVGMAALLCIGERVAKDHPLRFLGLAVIALFMAAFMYMLAERVFSIGILLGSDLEASNLDAYYRLQLSIAAMGGALLAGISMVVANFTKYCK